MPDPLSPRALETALPEIVRALDRHHVRYALIGGLAVAYRSRPRFTEDLDFLLDIPQLVLPGLLDDLAGVGFEFDKAVVIREWVREHLTSLTFRGVLIDWLKPVLPSYQHVLDHASAEDWLGQSVRIAAAEDLIFLKLIAFRGQDQVDVEDLLAANRGLLDLDRVRREWQTVADCADPRWRRFEEMVVQFYLPAGS